TDIMLTHITVNNKDAIYVVCRDISERKEIELELARQKNVLYYRANHDELTGLANRVLFMSELKNGLQKSKNEHQELVLMFIDLDRFKKINDSLGHSVGDAFLRIMGERLKHILTKDDMVARLGGDEFILIGKSLNKEKMTKTLLTIKNNLKNKHLKYKDKIFYITFSFGIANFRKNDYFNNIYKEVDSLMYKNKES
ncbi:MAG: GGDEF domain-containing protein, partial [Campylobacteraceae bacterium]|nr:GGDEF domain-containing protein [Campylobacteraceae bacterium]